jgi:phosphohistidine phosphatase SixA
MEEMLNKILATAALTLAMAVSAAAQPVVFLVRHAERSDSSPGTSPSMASDPDLSDAGRARAASLAVLLKDAGISAIYVTEYKRTQQTAAPLAKALGLTPTIVKATDAKALAKELAAAKGSVLVVGHSNTVPSAIKDLGVSSPVSVQDDEYDNLFVVVPGSRPSAIRLHYR